MKKRLWATFLALCLMLGMLPGTARAAEIASGECGADGDNVTWSLDSDGVLTISGTGEMEDYSFNDSSTYHPWASDYLNSIETVTIEEGVTSIGDWAFNECSGLTSITIPDSVSSIGDWAFANCNGLTSITIPDGVSSIGEGTFAGCNGLTSITIPDSVSSIGYAAFYYCSGLTSITIPDSVSSIGEEAFVGCNGLTSITIPDSVSSIGYAAFSECRELTSITIPDSVSSIGDWAFNECVGLTSITIPDSVSSIGEGTFANCVGLTSITIPDSVSSIGEGAFAACDSLTGITIPDNVSSIGEGAFEVCRGLISITIPDSVSSIGVRTFFGCNGLTSITIPDSVSSIGGHAFDECSSLTDVYYSGTESQWKQIDIDNEDNKYDALLNATIHCSDGVINPKEDEDTSTTLPDGVRYIPYSWTPEGEAASYSIAVGPLPSGLTLNEKTGEIHGVPAASGTWKVTILSGDTEQDYTITILDNTDDAVQETNDYPILDNVGEPGVDNTFYLDSYRDETMVIDGPYTEFTQLWIDGRLLTRNVDFEAREGSTVITIYSQTFRQFGNGAHTIAAEFRENGDPNGKLKATTSQNYTANVRTANPKPGGGKKPNKHSTTTTTTPAPTPTPEPSPTPTPDPTPAAGLPFGDVAADSWYYDDVLWVYENEVMSGTTATTFSPETDISQATIVTVLARMAGTDLSRFANVTDNTIESGKWYTEAAVWAKQSGLLPDRTTFTGEETISRDQMAVMLVKYLRSMGKDTTPPAQAVTFADAAEMSQDVNSAFQILYQNNIFRGVGQNRMDPAGSTTRAQFAALAHRLNTLARK